MHPSLSSFIVFSDLFLSFPVFSCLLHKSSCRKMEATNFHYILLNILLILSNLHVRLFAESILTQQLKI
jgi:hypothetical protein